MNHLASIEYRLKSIKYLTMLKKNNTYNELSRIFDLPITVLNRYIKGHVLPSFERAEEIYNIYKKIYDIKKEIRAKIKFDENKYFNISSLVGNIFLLKQVVSEIYNKYYDKNLTKVLTAAVNGIPLAVLTSNELGIDTLIAKKRREAGVSEFIVENYSPSRTGMILSLYLPVNMLSNIDRVLIIEDIIRSGETQQALCRIVTKSKALISGIFTFVGIGEKSWKTHLKKTILINYIENSNINNKNREEILTAFDNIEYDKIKSIINEEDISDEIIQLITNLFNDKIINVFINIPEPAEIK